MRIASLGHAVFAATMILLGILGLINKDFAALWHPVSNAVPAHIALGYLCALLSLACGIGLLWHRTVVYASLVLLAYLAIWSLLESLPGIFIAHASFGSWYSLAETGVMVAAAWVLYASNAPEWETARPRFARGVNGVLMARALFSSALIYFGIGHIYFLKETAADVPVWLPWHMAWAYLTGFAFIAGGLAILLGVFARLAAVLTTCQIGLFVLLVWLPMIASPGPRSVFIWSETIISASLTAGAWVIADSYRGMRWFAVNKRYLNFLGGRSATLS